jgi:DNA ligase-1
MLFHEFANSLNAIESESSRLIITQQLSDIYKKLTIDELRPASYLLQGSLVAPYRSLEFQLSTKMVIRALARLLPVQAATQDLFGEVTKESNTDVLQDRFKKLGDIGLLAEEVRLQAAEISMTELSLGQVFAELVDIANAGGAGSQEEKVSLLASLFQKSSPIGCKYISRIIIGRLRLGFSTMTLLDALSWTTTGGKAHRELLELAYQKRADVGELAEFYLGLDKEVLANTDKLTTVFDEYTVEIGIPVVPALCQRLNSAQEIISKMGQVIAEPKYDGLRVQIHFWQTKDGPQVVAYTRNLEEVTHQFPELQSLALSVNVQSCILDAEAIGFDSKTNTLLPFQQTITRKRKHGIEAAASLVPIRFYVFDILKLENQSLIDKPLQYRKDLLSNTIKDNEIFLIAPFITTDDPIKLKLYHEKLLSDGLEGAVIKQIDDRYISGRKGWSWVKIKEAEGNSGKLSDTLDLVVLGYYYGRGKRSLLGIGAFLVAALNINADGQQELLTVAKIGTGLSDELFKTLKEKADILAIKKPLPIYDVPKSLQPDVWIQPELVVEIAADEITHSPMHSAELALRFPRLIKLRDDKSWEQATTLEEMKTIGHI